jgi:hypothetical protein
MGESLVAVVDPSLTYFNPAILGVYHLKDLGSVGWSHANWWPGLNQSDDEVGQFYANLGFNFRLLKRDRPYNASFGVQYREHKLDYGWTEDRDQNNMPTWQGNTWDANRAVVVGLGFEYGFEFGLGVSVGRVFRYFYPELKTYSYDVGVLVRAPIIAMIEKYRWGKVGQTFSPFSLEITPSFGYARSNEGNDVEYVTFSGETVGDPLPTLDRYGLDFDFKLEYQSFDLFETRVTRSWTHHKVLTGYSGQAYKEEGWGVELSLLDAFIVRTGIYETNSTDVKRHTRGYTLQSRGLTAAISELYFRRDQRDASMIRYLLTHLNLGYHYSKWSASNSVFDHTEFYGFSFVF